MGEARTPTPMESVDTEVQAGPDDLTGMTDQPESLAEPRDVEAAPAEQSHADVESTPTAPPPKRETIPTASAPPTPSPSIATNHDARTASRDLLVSLGACLDGGW